MIISTQTKCLSEKFSDREAIEIIAKAGFDAYDFSFDATSEYDRVFNGDYIEYAKELREVADKCGIVCNQAHSPCDTSTGREEEDKEIYRKLIRSMEFAAVLGAKLIVVHPNQHLYYRECPDKLYEINMKFYRSLIPYCEKFGIKVAIENMWHENPITYSKMDSVCTRAWELNKYVDDLDSEWIVACLDLGHVALFGMSVPDYIRQIGKKRLQALHIHDNDYVHDDHTLPFVSKMDFPPIMRALGEIGYEGDFTYEADGFLDKFPKDFCPEVSAFMAKVARRLVEFSE